MDLETPNGKKIEIYQDGFSIRARFVGGGQLPEELAGTWTTKVFAQDSIRKYIERLPPKKHKIKLNKDDYKR